MRIAMIGGPHRVSLSVSSHPLVAGCAVAQLGGRIPRLPSIKACSSSEGAHFKRTYEVSK